MPKHKLTKHEDDILRNLRKSAEINPAQSPHDGMHTCSKGCKKPGCNRGLRDTIEEQDAQIEALKQDLLEQTARSRHVRMKVIHYLNESGGQQEELAALRSQFANSEWQPIETAPIDGTEFIGYSERCSMNVVHYGMSDDGEGWLIWAGFCTQLIEVPTHWMPLPKPPTK